MGLLLAAAAKRGRKNFVALETTLTCKAQGHCMKFTSLLSTATSTIAVGAAFLAVPAVAQSTGSSDFENTIVVTGGRINEGVAGVRTPDSPKAKVEVSQELISAQRAGQSVNEIINLVPGVSFTNNDPWGSSGGSFTIRGFGSDRISQTLDGIPLNDSGNYAVYTNQQVDAELIETVNVNLGSTDVDSPTPAAVGGTVNINTKVPDDKFGIITSMSYGDIAAEGSGGEDRSFQRFFAKVETGEFTSAGTKAWFSGSYSRNGATFANYGKVEKKQFNGKIYQPIGVDGDFISLAGHYNVNRNNFGGSPLSAQAIRLDKDLRFYDVAGGIPCTTGPTGSGDFPDAPNSCGSQFERRYNPSNTGNLRLNSLFHLSDKLTLSIDGAYQSVKANGGGTSVAIEGYAPGGFTGVFFRTEPTLAARGAAYYYYGNVDLNGDGVTGSGDAVRILSPSQTNTRRWVAIANLAYEIDDANSLRLSYSFDRARHRQTGPGGFLKANGEPFDVFPIDDPILDEYGNRIDKRDRLSYATLHQISGEYRGRFFDDQLTVLLGLRAPFFERELNQYCVTTSASGNVNCVGSSLVGDYLEANPSAVGPASRTIKYDKVLPNLGAVFKLTPALSIAASYAKNISAPSTDALYGTFFYEASDPLARRVAETSDSFDVSLRYASPVLQAAITGWYSKYKNRIVTATDIDGNSTDTNLGVVKKYGVDASVGVLPIPELSLYAFASYINSDIQNDAFVGSCTADFLAADLCYVDASGDSYLRTSGKRERQAPDWLVGGRAELNLGDFSAGAQAKYTGNRYLNDINSVKFKGYTVVDLNLRYKLESLGLDKTEVQLNVTNLFDKFYVGSFSGSLASPGSGDFVNFGSPRAISATLVMGF
ncbi:iron complex outermembrane recepter protein [Novosphingobium panipatense]|uniref:Iron complex outermembrane recepter protein n=2 Tax=Novosphingobium panipatense TaxID=428991 RepID=A0ABY1PXZ3_9SPHN|nr:iron complex outermembrane recepter protein [Novosphingobium panipatense]